MSTYRFYLFPFTSKVGPPDNMAPPSRAKGGAMAPVAHPPAAASGAAPIQLWFSDVQVTAGVMRPIRCELHICL